MKGRFFHGGLCRLVMACLLAASGVLGCLQIAGATDAYVQFKGKINACISPISGYNTRIATGHTGACDRRPGTA
jgi:hypothetical protein